MQHLFRGLEALVSVLLHPLGRFCGPLLKDLRTSARLDRGLVLVLPGIEGESLINHGIARGLADEGIDAAIEIYDWTTGVILFFLYHQRSRRFHERRARQIAERVIEYRRSYPGRPIHLVGHSGGAAMIILALEQLPKDVSVTSAMLLLSAMSPGYDLSLALTHVERQIVNYRSVRDCFFLGIGTLFVGTLDGPHSFAAGCVGFQPPKNLSDTAQHNYATRLQELAYRITMLADFNSGGHMGVVSRPFIAHRIAPWLKVGSPPT